MSAKVPTSSSVVLRTENATKIVPPLKYALLDSKPSLLHAELEKRFKHVQSEKSWEQQEKTHPFIDAFITKAGLECGWPIIKMEMKMPFFILTVIKFFQDTKQQNNPEVNPLIETTEILNTVYKSEPSTDASKKRTLSSTIVSDQSKDADVQPSEKRARSSDVINTGETKLAEITSISNSSSTHTSWYSHLKSVKYIYSSFKSPNAELGLPKVDSVDFTVVRKLQENEVTISSELSTSKPLVSSWIIMAMSAYDNTRPPTTEYRRIEDYFTGMLFEPIFVNNRPEKTKITLYYCVDLKDVDHRFALNKQLTLLYEKFNAAAMFLSKLHSAKVQK